MCNVACANCLIVTPSIQQIKNYFCLGDYVSFFTNILKMISWPVLHFLLCAVIVFHISFFHGLEEIKKELSRARSTAQARGDN